MGLLYDVYQKREENKKKRSCETGLKQKKTEFNSMQLSNHCAAQTHL